MVLSGSWERLKVVAAVVVDKLVALLCQLVWMQFPAFEAAQPLVAVAMETWSRRHQSMAGQVEGQEHY